MRNITVSFTPDQLAALRAEIRPALRGSSHLMPERTLQGLTEALEVLRVAHVTHMGGACLARVGH